jgi:hypothetical protein
MKPKKAPKLGALVSGRHCCEYRFARICIILGGLIRIRIRVESWIWIRIRIWIRILKSKERSGWPVDAQNGVVKYCRLVVTDSHHSYEKQDPDPHSDPHQCEANPQHRIYPSPFSDLRGYRSRTDVKSASPTQYMFMLVPVHFSPTYTKPTRLAPVIQCSGHFIVSKFVNYGRVYYCIVPFITKNSLIHTLFKRIVGCDVLNFFSDAFLRRRRFL